MENKTILVVESEPRLREQLGYVLESWSKKRHEIILVKNGEDALRVFKHQVIDVLITDIVLTDTHGRKLIQLVKQMKKRKPLTIIISQYSEFRYTQRAIQLGAVNYLLKPLKKETLIEAIQEALDLNEAGGDETICGGSEMMQLALQFINDNFKRSVTLREVADHVHLNPSYFSVLFHQQFDVTFSDYVRRLKIQEAKRLLLTTSLSIDAVAEGVGYRSPKYFGKLFNAYEGMTPSKYRKQHKTKDNNSKAS